MVLLALASASVLAVSTPGTVDLESAVLALGHGRYSAVASEACERPWLQCSIPIPHAGQTPLAIGVTSDPPGAVRGLQIVEERENRYLRVHLRPLGAGERIEVQADALVLLRERTPDDGNRVALAKPGNVPDAVREHLAPAPGVESDAPAIAAAAAELSRDDLRAFAQDLLAFLGRKIAAGSGPQGALTVLERGSAACTGCANLAAALSISRGVPARILPCILIGMEQQEHYIVELWTPELGWSKVESTLKLFPLDDTKHLVLRIAYPSSPRSAGDVPLYRPIGEGVACDFATVGKKAGSWQAAEVVARRSLDAKELDLIEAAARAAFAAAALAPTNGARLELVSAEDPPERVKDRGKKLIGEIRAWLPR